MPIITKGFESISSIGEILGANDIEDNRGKTVLTTLRGEYDFKDIHFAYQPDQPLLRGLDLHVKAGETIAIVGFGQINAHESRPRIYLPQFRNSDR